METKCLCSFVAAALLAGCGGGGGSSSDTTGTATAPASLQASAAGLWSGTTDTNRSVTGLVFPDGTYYVLYSVAGAPSTIAGVVQGTGSVNGSTFSSTNGRDFNLEGAAVVPVNVSASVTTKTSFTGNVAYSSGTIKFTSTYNADFEREATITAVAGTYSGRVASSQGVENAAVTVSTTGAVSGTGVGGCTVSGSVSSRTDGNAYNVTLTFGPAPCFFAGQTFTGIAYYDAGAKRLYAAAPNSARSDGVLFVGSKP